MLDIGKELEPYVTNYKLNLFDYHTCKDFSVFKTENRELFEVLSCAHDEEKMNEMIHGNHQRYEKLDRDTTSLICNIAGIAEDSMMTETEVREETDMCKAWDDHIERGRREGRTEGKNEGQCEAIRKMMEKLKMTAVQAMEILDIAEEERDKYMAML